MQNDHRLSLHPEVFFSKVAFYARASKTREDEESLGKFSDRRKILGNLAEQFCARGFGELVYTSSVNVLKKKKGKILTILSRAVYSD